MPLTVPSLDTRRYQELRDEALARIPVHTPEWTNYNRSDPGVTIIEVMAFMVESLLYRANQIPERMRRKFLTLLDIPLHEATSARGVVIFANLRGPLDAFTLSAGLDVNAGQITFRTQRGLDVLPIIGQIYYKNKLMKQSEQVKDYYRQLYLASSGTVAPANVQLYETKLFTPESEGSVDLAQQTVDNTLWLALMARSPRDDMEQVRMALGGKTLSIGIVPALSEDQLQLRLGPNASQDQAAFEFYIPSVAPDGKLSETGDRTPQYQRLEASASVNLSTEPGIVEITLPRQDKLVLWSNIEPLEAGTANFPPALDDPNLEARVITWVAIHAPPGLQAHVYWVGVNAVEVSQRTHVANETLLNGTGEPDQTVRLTQAPVLAKSVSLTITVGNNPPETWTPIDDLMTAGPEVPTPDPRQPPGITPSTATEPRMNVFLLNPESGEIRFGDGFRGRRPPFGSVIRASYDYSVGSAGNIPAGAIGTSAALPSGVTVTNPIRTWGGAQSETVDEGEKQITRYLQHRDRLVSAADFETITWRTPGVQIGRVDVLPASRPTTLESSPGAVTESPGTVTIMTVPRYDTQHTDAPQPDRIFLDTICRYLEPRRLVTTELYLKGPSYVDIDVVVAFAPTPDVAPAEVREAIKQHLLRFLSPLPNPESAGLTGWPLYKPVVALELLAVASRTSGVKLINTVLVAQSGNASVSTIPMDGLQLPHVVITVIIGDAQAAADALQQLRGRPLTSPNATPFFPVPVIPEECR